MDRDDICVHASPPDIDGTRLCHNEDSDNRFKFCIGVHACQDGEV